MPLTTFLRGLRQRNWQHPSYVPQSQPWQLDIYEDAGRLLRPIFPGFRVLVTKSDGSQFWVPVTRPGKSTVRLEDTMAGGGPGGVWGVRRGSEGGRAGPADVGYHMVFEEIFNAFEPRLTAKGRAMWDKYLMIDHTKPGLWDCPGENLLKVQFARTRPEFSLAGFWDKLPSILFIGFAFSFTFVAIGLGIFKPRKQMPSDPLQAMEFAQSKAKARKDGATDVAFDDVAGIDNVKADLLEIVAFMKDPKGAGGRAGARAPKGVLLEGPPGTGKTLIAKAVAGEAGVPFYQMSGSEFVEVIVGVGAARVRDLFKRARARAEAGGCVIFVDEIDAIGIKRADVGQETNEEREQTLNQLLTEMDGFASDSGVMFIAATNRADLLDPALLRAGRFDRKVRVQRPDEKGRLAILKVHARRFNLAPDVDLEQLARDLLGLSGAELENVLNEGALEAVRRLALAESAKDISGEDLVTRRDLDAAVDRITQGVRRPALVPGGVATSDLRQSHPQMRAFAVTEGGRAVVASVLRQVHGHLEPLERVSVVPRGSTMARCVFARGTDEAYVVTRRGKLLDQLVVLMSGRVAQEELLGYAATYDVEAMAEANRLALKMATAYGMEGSSFQVGSSIPRWAPPPSALTGGITNQLFDGDTFGLQAQEANVPPSDESVFRANQAALRLLLEAEAVARATVRANREVVQDVVMALLEKEELRNDDLVAIATQRGGFREMETETETARPGSWGWEALRAGASDAVPGGRRIGDRGSARAGNGHGDGNENGNGEWGGGMEKVTSLETPPAAVGSIRRGGGSLR